MAKLPPARDGSPLQIKQRRVPFSFWPMRRSTRRYGLQSRVFATDPWSVIRHSINQRCPAASKPQAQAFRDQAHDYFRAAEVAGLFTAKPVLLYYSFLNLVKAFVLTEGGRNEYGAAYHGLKERLPPSSQELVDSYLEAIPSGQNVNIFDDFLMQIHGQGLGGSTRYRMAHVLPQLLQGHRLWCSATGFQERFIDIARIDLIRGKTSKELWLVLNIFEDDLTRLDLPRTQLLRDTRLFRKYREVRSDKEIGGRHLLKFEQIRPVPFNHRPSDAVPQLVESLKGLLWANVLSIPPYRKYYVYTAPQAERAFILPQLLSIFAFFYYLGSVTRYKPQRIGGLVRGDYGAYLEEAVVNLPGQFLFLMASEFSRQEITKAAIV